MNIPDKNWSRELERIMRGASAILMKYVNTDLVRTQKENQGFVTQADVASETYLIHELTQLFPDAGIMAEESGTNGTSEYQWVIDPLDGTNNFAHGIDYFCISVALTHKNIPLIGAIFHPARDEFFFARQGKGAFLNGQSISVTDKDVLAESMIALGLPYEGNKRLPLLTATQRIMRESAAVRHCGAIALDLAQVACGRFDGLFFSHLRWWDVAAGLILVQEAGGIVTDFEGNIVAPGYATCLAGGPKIHILLRSVLN